MRTPTAWTVGAVVVFCSSLLGGCATVLTPQAEQMLSAGQTAFRQGDYETTIERMDAFLLQHGKTDAAGKAYCLRGRAKYELNQTDAAREDLIRAAEADDEQTRAQALVTLGDIAYGQGDMALAENRYRDGLTAIDPTDPLFAHGQFRLGCVLQRQGRWSDADQAFNKVIYHRSGSDLADEAARRVHNNAWTIQAGAFAEKRRAENYAERLRRELPSVRTVPDTVDDSLLFLVQVGRYPTYEQAQADLPKVRKQRHDAFITVTR